MKADMISVGTEYLTGMIPEKNLPYLAGRMAELDVNIRRQMIVGSEAGELESALEDSFKGVELVLLIGGIDYTANCRICEQYFQTTFGKIENVFELENHQGTAPGIIYDGMQKSLIILPANPNETQAIFEDDVVGYIFSKVSMGKASLQIVVKPEADITMGKLSEQLGGVLECDNPTVNMMNDGERFIVKISAVGPTNGDAMILTQLMAADCCKRIGSDLIETMKEI